MRSVIQKVYHSAETLSKHPHFHDCHQIIFIVQGSVKLCINNKTLHATAGDVAIFSRYENHSVVGCSDTYERFVLHIDPDVVNRNSPVYSILTDRPAGFYNIINISSAIDAVLALFRCILLERSSPSKLSDEMEQLLVKQLLIHIYRCASVDLDRIFDEVVIDVKRRFENEYHKQYTLQTLARQYSISVSSLSHRFRAATGVSLMEYLQSCRMANAKQLLAETGCSIGQIVEKCGFSDNSNFSRTFKKLNGLSPSAFRRRYNGA